MDMMKMKESEMENETESEEPEECDIACWTDAVIKGEEIKQDAEKMKYVQPELDKRRAAIDAVAPAKSIADLRKKASKMK